MSAIGEGPSVYVILGCPGSGKGVLAKAITGYVHFSIGDTLRDELARATEFGLKYADAIRGHIPGGIPSDAINELVKQKMSTGSKFILDGYPKDPRQCEYLDRLVSAKGVKGGVECIILDVDKEVAIARIAYRQTCEKCQKIYNSKFSPSKIPETCDECQGRLTHRVGDDLSITRRRVYEFDTKMQPVVEFYRLTKRCHVIDGNDSPHQTQRRFLLVHQMKTNVKSQRHVAFFAIGFFLIVIGSIMGGSLRSPLGFVIMAGVNGLGLLSCLHACCLHKSFSKKLK